VTGLKQRERDITKQKKKKKGLPKWAGREWTAKGSLLGFLHTEGSNLNAANHVGRTGVRLKTNARDKNPGNTSGAGGTRGEKNQKKTKFTEPLKGKPKTVEGPLGE